MSRNVRMLRRIASLIALLALSMNVAQAGTYADLADAGASQHCAGQAQGQDDCPCCPDTTPISGCAGLCSMMTALPWAPVDVPPAPGERTLRANEHGAHGPAYLPLNPPPIA